jgi:hypothetical protein
MTDRIRLDDLTSDDLDQLYAELEQARAEANRYAENESADIAAGSYAGRVEELEAAHTRIRRLAARIRQGVPWASNFDNLADRIIAELDDQPADDTTPGCTCGHTGRGLSWHADECPWRRSVVDCPGRPTPG